MKGSASTLRIERLSKSFGGLHALDGVTFEFPKSGIIGLIGPNGAGKTTLINVVTGFLHPDAGRCYLGASDVTRFAPHEIARMGVVRTFQDLRLITLVTALENVMLARPNQKGERLFHALFRSGVALEESENREVALRLLRSVGLDGKADDIAGELSYGQQKLLTLVCCLATDAQVLLLDEPVSGVQPDMAVKILEMLQFLGRAGRLVIFVEHDIASVRAIAEQVIVMDEGRIVAYGPTLEVLARPEIIEAFIT